MKKFKCLLTAMLLACSTASFAQFTNGGGGGGVSSDVEAWKGLRFSYDKTFTKIDINGAEDEDMNGFSFGYEHAFKVGKKLPFFIQTGAGINFARYKDDWGDSYDSYEQKRSVLGLTIPVNVVYGIKINDMLAIKPYTGLYIRINLMAKEKITNEWDDGFGDTGSESVDYSFFDGKELDEKSYFYDKDDEWNRCQVGWQIGATLDIKQFNVGIGYALDFNEIAEKTKTSKFAVTVGYNF